MPRPLHRQHGQAALESLVVLGALLSCALIVFETTQWWLLRQQSAQALFEALRQGSIQGGRIQTIQAALESGLAPRHARPHARQGDPRQGLYAHALRFHQRHGIALYRLTPISPIEHHFQAFGVPDRQGQRRIPATFYAERHHRLNPDQARQFEQALSLTLQLDYLHAPSSAWLRRVLAWSHRRTPDPDPWIRLAQDRGLLVIRQRLSLPMQSDAIQETRQTHYFPRVGV